MRAIAALALLLSPFAFAAPPPDEIDAHPEWDAAYTRAIREATTAPDLSTDLVDHLSASASVPTPLAFNGYIAGAPDHLTYAADIHRYMRALAAASPRVRVLSIGTTEEGREMIAVAIADEATIATLDEHKAITRRLADPRAVDETQAREMAARGKPIYYLTGGLHSPETGASEMLMELAYRLAVEDTPLVASIRNNVITLITPVLEVDGRERMVDLARCYLANRSAGLPPLAYWGHYVAHDNNRDAIGLALALSRNLLAAYLDWHPQVVHDLHESIPFLYISSGTGPYNAWLDPVMVDEWERMAFTEVRSLTARGLPGVWTHGFYDGWAPNYLFWIGMGRNSIGRFYETFGNHIPTTEDRVVRGSSDRAWYRPNPPLPKVRWSLRNNVNYQESGVLLALASMAAEPRHSLEQFWLLGKRSVAKARTEGPAAYVFDANQKRQGQLADLMHLLRRHGVEVQVADEAFAIKPGWPPPSATSGEKSAAVTAETQKNEAGGTATAGDAKQPAEKLKHETLRFPAGSFIVRMDQPYSRLADALLDTQYVRGDEKVYDDTGWTQPLERNLECARIVNQEVLAVPMRPWNEAAGEEAADAGALAKAAAVAISNHADTDLVRLLTALSPSPALITEEDGGDGVARPAGTVVVPLDASNRGTVSWALSRLHLEAAPLAALPKVATHELTMPRIALLHAWLNTQDEGWFRLAFEDLKVPYTYISTQDVARDADLGARFDVIVFPPAGWGGSQDIVNGLPPGPPLPWKRTEGTPNLGVDETDDMRPGLGLEGVQHLAGFVESGGLLITVGSSARMAVEYGLARFVKVATTDKLKAPGTIVKASVSDRGSPIAYGYDDTLPVYLDGGPLFQVGVFEKRKRDRERVSGRGGKSDPDVPQGRPYAAPPPEPEPGPGEEGFQLPEDLPFFFAPYLPAPELRPRVILAFPKEADTLLLSGMLDGADELASKPALIDCPRGTGHVLLFSCNPMWRATTQGSYALVTNAIFNWNHLDLGRKAVP